MYPFMALYLYCWKSQLGHIRGKVFYVGLQKQYGKYWVYLQRAGSLKFKPDWINLSQDLKRAKN